MACNPVNLEIWSGNFPVFFTQFQVIVDIVWHTLKQSFLLQPHNHYPNKIFVLSIYCTVYHPSLNGVEGDEHIHE